MKAGLIVTDNELLDTIHELVERKKVSEEKLLAPAIPVLNRYIENQLDRLEDIKLPKTDRSFEMAQLNELFHKVLGK